MLCCILFFLLDDVNFEIACLKKYNVKSALISCSLTNDNITTKNNNIIRHKEVPYKHLLMARSS